MAAPAGAQQHRVLSELRAAHPHSTPAAVTSTAEGDILFMAESGALAVVDATLGQSAFNTPLKVLPISSHGVRAVDLLLDPDAVLDEDPDDPEDLLYVAGGRLGLWAMKADPRSNEPMPATRIDAGFYTGGTGRTWCNSLEIMTLPSVSTWARRGTW